MTYHLLTPREFVERLRAEGNDWAPEILDALDAAEADYPAADELEAVRKELKDEAEPGERTYETIERLLAEREALDDALELALTHDERVAELRRLVAADVLRIDLLALLEPYGATDADSAMRTLRMLLA